MRTELAIKRELAKVERQTAELLDNLPRGVPVPPESYQLRGAQQALAWVLERHAIAASRAYSIEDQAKRRL